MVCNCVLRLSKLVSFTESGLFYGLFSIQYIGWILIVLLSRRSWWWLSIYKVIVKPIYGQLWGCAKTSNRMIIQRSQNKFLRAAVHAYHYTRDEDIHRDLKINSVDKVIQEIASRHEKRLHRHVSTLALQLLANSDDTRRLKRLKPYDFVCYSLGHENCLKPWPR